VCISYFSVYRESGCRYQCRYWLPRKTCPGSGRFGLERMRRYREGPRNRGKRCRRGRRRTRDVNINSRRRGPVSRRLRLRRHARIASHHLSSSLSASTIVGVVVNPARCLSVGRSSPVQRPPAQYITLRSAAAAG